METTVAETAEACLLSFNKCLELFAVLSPQQQSAVEDQLGRFSIWTANIGVFAPYRSSLDYRLRDVADIQRLVRGLLRTLHEHIQEYSSHLGTLSLTGKSTNHEENNRLGVVVDNIAGEITLLHQLSNTIRKASNERNNVKAATSFVIRDEDGNDMGPAFVDLFAMEIIRRRFPDCDEKIMKRLAEAMLLRRKRVLYRRSRYGNAPTRHAPSAPRKLVPSTRKEPGGFQNTPGPIGHQHPGRSNTETPQQTPSTAESRAMTATTLHMEQWKKALAPSVAGTSRTIQLGNSEHLEFPPAPKGPILQKLKELKENRLMKHEERLNSLPNYLLYIQHDEQTTLEEDVVSSLRAKISGLEVVLQEEIENDRILCDRGSMEVVCPYCCCALSSATVMSNHLWIDHVKHDLDPYVCLFETCDHPNALYKHSEDWLKHMRQHSLRWRCAAKAHGVLVFVDQNEYEEHMTTAHKSARSQLSIIATRSSRSSGPIFESCPLCGKSDSDRQLEGHIATHLRYLALKSLPFPEDLFDDQGSDRDSGDSDASTRRKRSTISGDSDNSSLSFDTTPEIDDSPEDMDAIERFELDSPKNGQSIPPPIANNIETLSIAQSKYGDKSYKSLASNNGINEELLHTLSNITGRNRLQDNISVSENDPGPESKISKDSLDDNDEYKALPMRGSDVPSGDLEKAKASDLSYHSGSHSNPCESVESKNKTNILPQESPAGNYQISHRGRRITESHWYCEGCHGGPYSIWNDHCVNCGDLISNYS